MKISIVTPTLNSAKYLRETLDSIRRAFHGLDVEHIIVDGGSTDGTLLIPEQGVSTVYHLPEKSMYEAIDFGFSHSTGEILCWLNSDDRYCDETGRIVASMFAKDPSAQIVSGSCWYINERGERLFPKHFVVHQKIFLNSFDSLMLCQPSTFWRREVYAAVGGLNTSYKVVSDRDFFLRAINRFGLRYTTSPLAEFRIHDLNKSIVEGTRARQENALINSALDVGPTSVLKKIAAAAGHYVNIAFNPKMVAWKLVNGKTKI